ncbi:MAG: precorrin-2 C(20)-methyltransferase [Desulfovibrionaceae bacterium]
MIAGKLYGVGVGPGDPELLTLKAVKILSKADHLFAAASTKNESSLALDIAREHLRDGVPVELLGFPMTRDEQQLHAAWENNARRVAEVMAEGKNCVFLTLGDPMTYSTFGYLLRTLRNMYPEASVECVPGITSYQAAAARTLTILVESKESLVVASGVDGEKRLEQLLQSADRAVILKCYKNFPAIRRVVRRLGLEEGCRFVSRLGREDELVAGSLSEAPETPHYLSLMLLGRPRK